MSTSNILGIVGAGVGFLVGSAVGNPLLGAQIGFTLGSAAGSYIDPVTIKAPGLSEAPAQTSNDGVPRPLIWGLHGGIHGNIIQKCPETQITTSESQGKGGGAEVEETRRYRTFAIRVCEGPTSEITRIFRNGILVYDIRETPAIPEAETAKFAEGLNIYLGTEDQLPDSELEAHWGEDTPAYRGSCYVVFVNHDLTEVGGSIPQFSFEVNGSKDHTITSKPYPIEVLDGLQSSVRWEESQVITPPLDGIDHTMTVASILLADSIESYEYETEGFDVTVTVPSITLDVRIHSYTYEIEGVDPSMTVSDIALRVALITHVYDIEGIDPTVAVSSITLS
jgi:hypothetical protein